MAIRNNVILIPQGLCSSDLEASRFLHGNVSDLPTSIDWREQGAVTPFKDQGECGKFDSKKFHKHIQVANHMK